MLTMAVFAICITAPLGAIFINTLGPKWLSCDLPEGAADKLDETSPIVGSGPLSSKIVPEV